MIRLLIAAFAFLVLVNRERRAVSPSGNAPLHAVETGTVKLTSPTEISGVKSLVVISEGIWRGAQPMREGFATLRALGIKTIVNLRTTRSDRNDLAGLGLDLIELRVKPYRLDDREVLAFLKVATDSQTQPVFVHYKRGADRTGAMVAAYRMGVQGWERSEALAELPRFGFHEVWVNIHRYLKNVDVSRLEAELTTTEALMVQRVE